MVKLCVNGQEQSFDGDPSMPLLWYLRDELASTGTKFGCGVALCSACTIHIDGQATRSCITSRGRAYDGPTAMKVPGVEKIIVIEATPLPSKFEAICGVAVIALNCPRHQSARA